LISRDEALHCEFACLLYERLNWQVDAQRVVDIVTSAVSIEQEFIRDALPVRLIGMNSEMMSQYIEFCADRLLVDLNVPKHYNSPNPFDWMEMISLQGKSNFFERRVAEYAKAGVGEKDHRSFATDVDF
jgi:ribonucleotide reductase beta subunit family protein with ferritin-like domain